MLARGSYYYLGWAFQEQAVLNPGSVPPTLAQYRAQNLSDPQAIVTYAMGFLNPDLVGAAFTLYGFYSSNNVAKTNELKDAALGPIPRLRIGIERFFITDINNPSASAKAASEIPVMWDEIAVYGAASTFNHVPGGGNVLYMDGHVEFLKWPSIYPANVIGVLLSALF
jgi:prepilin-type processing-associated H-X9-DG protein